MQRSTGAIAAMAAKGETQKKQPAKARVLTTLVTHRRKHAVEMNDDISSLQSGRLPRLCQCRLKNWLDATPGNQINQMSRGRRSHALEAAAR
jgi:hypothetical protein